MGTSLGHLGPTVQGAEHNSNGSHGVLAPWSVPLLGLAPCTPASGRVTKKPVAMGALLPVICLGDVAPMGVMCGPPACTGVAQQGLLLAVHGPSQGHAECREAVWQGKSPHRALQLNGGDWFLLSSLAGQCLGSPMQLLCCSPQRTHRSRTHQGLMVWQLAQLVIVVKREIGSMHCPDPEKATFGPFPRHWKITDHAVWPSLFQCRQRVMPAGHIRAPPSPRCTRWPKASLRQKVSTA